MLISTDNSGLQQAANAINRGELVAFPTDTFFALGADGFNSAAVENVFVTKGRNPGTPVPLLVSGTEMAEILVKEFPEPLKLLADEFWPGALTVVLPASDRVPEVVTARTGTVGIRVPGHDVARELIELAGVPVTGTSCNLTGQAPINEAVVVDQVFGSQVPVVVDSPCGDSSAPSTVISFENKKVVVLREGAISAESLRNIVGDIVVS